MVTGLSPDNELFLNQVVATGRFASREEALNEAVAAFRIRAEARQLAAGAPSVDPKKMSAEEWIKNLREWSASHPHATHFVDDSRESIYEGRGE